MQNLTWPPNAATWLLLWPLITAVLSLVYNYLDRFPRVHAVLEIGVKAGIDLPAILEALKRFATGMPSAGRLAKMAAKTGGAIVVLLVLGLSQSACIDSSTTVPVNAGNQGQVNACLSSARVHNDSVIVGIGLGALATGAATTAAADSDPNVRTGMAVTGAATAALAAGAASLAGLTASNFASNHCSEVVTPLPAKDRRTMSAWPADWPAPGRADSVVVTVRSAEGVISSVTSPVAP
jgi:hypothetical protein